MCVCVYINTHHMQKQTSAGLMLTPRPSPSSPWHFENPSVSFVSVLSRSCSVLPGVTHWFPPAARTGPLSHEPQQTTADQSLPHIQTARPVLSHS